MKKTTNYQFFFFFISILFFGHALHSQETRLLRNPAISANNIAFLYAGDLWIANLDGSNVKRITAFEGVESDPHFSPDGQLLAFTGQYDGNTDVYVIPITGGDPKRMTWHPGPDLVCGWTQDGKNILFSSGRAQVPYAENDQLWLISLDGTTPTQFNIPRVTNGKYAPDGSKFVFQEISPWETEFRNYRGGQNNPLKIFDLKTYETKDLPWENSRDIDPVWVDNNIYFLSDRDLGMNIWQYNTVTKELKQITFFKEFDCKNQNAVEGSS